MNKKNRIMDVLLIIVLVICNLMMGSPLRYNIEIPCLVIGIVGIIYLIFAIKEKTKIKYNRFDVLVVALAITSFIPLIANSYIRLRYTIEYILRYMSSVIMYFILIQYLKQDRKKINIIVNFVTIMSIVIVFFGIDMMTTKTFDGFYNFIKTPRIIDESKERILSLFKYPNSLCAYLGLSLFITIGGYFSNNGKEKRDKVKRVLYTNAIFVQLFGIVMTFSRLGWLIIFLLLILYIICLKDKRKDIIELLILTGVNTFIYFCIFQKFLNSGNYVALCGFFIIQNIVQFIIFFRLNSIKGILKKLNKKIFIAVLLLSFISIIIWYFTLPDELVLFNSSTSQKKYSKPNILVEANTEYRFNINLTAQSNLKDNFAISIKELNEREELINTVREPINEIDGNIELVIKTSSDTKFVSLLFHCMEPNENTKMVVHSVKMNDSDLKVYYKVLPMSLITRIGKIRFDSASVNTRFEYIKESVKIIKQNPIFGFGGYAWRGFSFEDLKLQTIAEHCYPLQLFMQNGIIAFWLYIYIILMVVGMFVKKIKNKEMDIISISFFMSLFFLILHSFFDFDMYFLIMLIDMYLCFAIINDVERKELKEVKAQKILYCIYGIILVLFIYFSIGETVAMRFYIEDINNENEKLEVLNTHIVLFPYDYYYYKEKALLLQNMKNNGKSIDNMNINQEIKKCLKFLEDVEKLEIQYTTNNTT